MSAIDPHASCKTKADLPAPAHHACCKVDPAAEAAAAVSLGKYDLIPADYDGPVYTCPMHPEVRDTHNSGCPICGMALEPEGIVVGEEDTSELDDMTRRFWVCAVLSIPLLIYAMSDMIPEQPFSELVSPAWVQILQLLLATPVVVWGAAPFFKRGWQSVRSLNLNMFTLIAIGVGVAFIFSLIATFVPDIFPAGFRDADGRVGVYYEAAAVIITLVLLGQVLELRARSRTSGAIRALLELAPPTARRLDASGDEHEIPLDEVRSGDLAARAPRRKDPSRRGRHRRHEPCR